MQHILIIDDDADMCKLLSRFLTKNGYEVECAYSGKKGLEAIDTQLPDVILCDFRLQDTDGKTLLLKIKEKQPEMPVIIITGYSDVKMAVDVMKHGAFDYVTKPLFPEEILQTIQKAIDTKGDYNQPEWAAMANNTIASPASKTNNKNAVQYIFPSGGVFGEVLKQILLVAPTNYSVIIYGESGSGKESVAQHIHEHSNRKNKPFIAIDCGALSRELAGSELFGHDKGAFTGAVTDKTGSLELANGGTVFLDEVSNLSYEIQVLLLRVVQERRMRKVGGIKEIDLDIRIIVASNELLYDATQKGKFREDLYHRFNEFSIMVPPLRDRANDIMLFATFFLKNANAELQKNITGFAIAVEQLFKQYAWPGNLRELKNVIKRAALIAEGNQIEHTALPFELVNHSKLIFEGSIVRHADTGAYNNQVQQPHAINGHTLRSASIDAEYDTIVQALKQANYNKSKAAKILNVDRKTLYNKMRQYREFNEEV